MSGLLLIPLAMIAYAIVLFFKDDAPEQGHDHTFTANLKRGEIHASVRAHYRDHDTDVRCEAERTIRQWAAGTEIHEVTPDHYKLLDSILGEALAGYRPKVISIAVSGNQLPPPELPVQTEAERLRADIMAKVECGETLIAVLENQPV
jgi:hypothetical protein